MNDPRVFFAAERTLLAWVRTGITVMALGFVVERFGLFVSLVSVQGGRAAPQLHTTASSVIGTLLVVAGVAVIVFASVQHARFVKTLPLDDLPPSYSIGWALVFSLTFAALGGALAIYLALT
ncbi:MAG: YidH family protein [Vicinamibacteria bacterium]